MTSFIGLRWQIWHPTPLVAREVACQRPFYCVHLLRRWRRRVSWRPRKFIHSRPFEPKTSHNFVHFWHMASCGHCYVKTVLLRCDNHPQNVRLSTHKMHCGATVQLAVPGSWQECFTRLSISYVWVEGIKRKLLVSFSTLQFTLGQKIGPPS